MRFCLILKIPSIHAPKQGIIRSINIPRTKWVVTNCEEARLQKIFISILLHTFYQPRTCAKISGATIVASDSMMYFGVFTPSLPQVIFSFGTAPE